MRTRIIFRGLTAFTTEKPSRGAAAGDNLGTLTAWQVSDPTHATMPLHKHTPRYAVIGRDVNNPNGPGFSGMKTDITSDLRIEYVGSKAAAGVIADGSFLDFVPCLGELHWYKGSRVQNPSYIMRKIEIPNGRIRAGEFIAWDWYGKTPAKVGYMDTPFTGYGANEVIVDIGDDDDIDKDDPKSYLRITDGKREEKIWPRVKGGATDDDIESNVVEVEITNLTARRRRPVFWGLHFQALFQAAGYPARDYTGNPQYRAFEAAAKAYDAYEWGNDAMMVDAGQPFPFIVDPKAEALDRIAQGAEPSVVNGPPSTPPSTRQSGEGIPGGGGTMGGMSGMRGMGHDPANTQLCPFGRE